MHTPTSDSERAYRRTSLLLVTLLAMAAWDCQVNCQGCCDSRDVAQEGTPCAEDADCPTGEACVDQRCKPGGSEASATTAKTPAKKPRPNATAPAEAAGFDKEYIGTSCKEHSDCHGELMCAGGSCVPAPACTTNSDCAKGMYCDQTLRRCRAPICLWDPDCLDGQVCVFGECMDKAQGCTAYTCERGTYCNVTYYECEAIDCEDDAQCAGDRKCHNTSCKDCFEDAHCPEGSKCEVISGRCQEPEVCQTDDQCHEGRICDPKTQACAPPPCVPDKYAGNDSRDNAIELRDGTYNFTRCERFGNDWFVLELNKGDGFELYADFRGNPAHLEFRIYDADYPMEMDRFYDSSGSGRIFALFEAAPKTGTYYLRAKRSAEATTTYSFRFNKIENGRCFDDDLEPNDSMDKAYRLTSERLYTSRYCGNEDWYSFDLGPDEVAQVTMTIVKGPTPRLMVLEEPQEEGQAPRIVGETTSEGSQLVRFKSDEGGNYYIRVFSGEAKHTYYELQLKPLGRLPDDPDAVPPGDEGRIDRIPQEAIDEHRKKFEIKVPPKE